MKSPRVPSYHAWTDSERADIEFRTLGADGRRYGPVPRPVAEIYREFATAASALLCSRALYGEARVAAEQEAAEALAKAYRRTL